MSITFNADEVFEMGMDVEKNGYAYYKKASEMADDPNIKKAFTYLGEEELKHFETFKELRDSLAPRETTPTVIDTDGVVNLYLDALVKSRLFLNEEEAEKLAAGVESEIEALKIALAFEKDTILFFQTMKSMTRENLGQDKIDQLIAEEQKHVIRISGEIKRAQEKADG
ncbi:MAG: ferritin family protein [Candidatus Krumholzibacteriota bacterium]|nr:ferritin family protein [Candidatus Krumholzibacteriota bacterium]